MKKFLSLVLALVMTMSLVTVSAGATEYKDLTDKNEIKYAEAVAVMNKIGIISGYTDGSFKPAENLTRGAAAKIITYMMLGSIAGEQLGVVVKPYKDVAMDNTFAPYIAYCKSTGLINGYSDGTFRPSGALDGYSFSKMLLTALGYKSENAGFIGSGWQTNVARLAVKEGLLRGNDGFVGSKIVTREEACLYAFNTLKATMVEYKGSNIKVEGADGTTVTVGNQDATYVENSISSRGETFDNNADKLTQFCEEHFSALKLVDNGSATDSFGRPANKWAYKSAEIGVYALAPTFSFTAGTGDTLKDDTFNAKALGMNGYRFGSVSFVGNIASAVYGTVTPVVNGVNGTALADANGKNGFVALAGLTGNGISVEVYVSGDIANLITNVVVIKTQLMKIDRINTSAKTVAFSKVDEDADGRGIGETIKAVDAENPCYTTLSTMKADDYVLVTYVRDGGNWVATKVAVPTIVTGKLTRVSTNSAGFQVDPTKGSVNGVSVAGTDYKLSATRGIAFRDLNSTSISANKECTLYVDTYGYGAYIKDVVAADNYMFVTDVFKSTVDRRTVTIVAGIGTDGSAIELNIGSKDEAWTDRYEDDNNFSSLDTGHPIVAGDMLTYRGAIRGDAALHADYSVTNNATANVSGPIIGVSEMVTGAGAKLEASNTKLASAQCTNLNNALISSNVKVIFLNDEGASYTLSSVKDGMANVGNVPANSYAVYTKTGNNYVVSAIFIGQESDDTIGKAVGYISAKSGAGVNDATTNKPIYFYQVYVDGVKEDKEWRSTDNLQKGDFITFDRDDAKDLYTLRIYNTATLKATAVTNTVTYKSHVLGLLTLNENVGNVVTDTLNAKGAKFINTTDLQLNNLADFADYLEAHSNKKIQLKVVFNDLATSNDYRKAYYIVVTGVANDYTARTVNAQSGVYLSKDNKTWTDGTTAITVTDGDTVYAKAAATKLLKSSAVTLTPVEAVNATKPTISKFVVSGGDVLTDVISVADTYNVAPQTDVKVSLSATTGFADSLNFIEAGTPVYVKSNTAGAGMDTAKNSGPATVKQTAITATEAGVYSFAMPTGNVADNQLVSLAAFKVSVSGTPNEVSMPKDGLTYMIQPHADEYLTKNDTLTVQVAIVGTPTNYTATATLNIPNATVSAPVVGRQANGGGVIGTISAFTGTGGAVGNSGATATWKVNTAAAGTADVIYTVTATGFVDASVLKLS